MNKKRIAYVLGSKFPTGKAYGVTTRETILEIKSMGHDLKLFCFKSEYSDIDSLEIEPLITNFRHGKLENILMKYGESSSSQFSKFCWQFGMILAVTKNVRFVKNFNPHIIWLRDPLIALIFLLFNRNSKVILEIHTNSLKFAYLGLKVFSVRVLFAPINKINFEYICSLIDKPRIVLAPMSIRSVAICSEQEVKTFISNLNKKIDNTLSIGYIGSIAPQKYSKGIEDLIELARICESNEINFKITIVGYVPEELEFISKNISDLPKNIFFEARVSHSQSLKLRQSFDVLILPMPLDTNYTGMPLKLMEYLSAGRITILADSVLLKDCLNNNVEAYFYESGNPLSLLNKILTAVSDSNLESNILNGIRFSSQFTWQARTSSILSSFDKDFK
jgi:glycosyltransferase involved in cell wall biosynthesis